jgi:putative copper resistance protein D
MEAFLVVSRFAQVSAAMLLLGTSLFGIQFQRGSVATPDTRRAFDHWQRPMLLSAAAIALTSSIAWLDIEAGMMGGSWADAANLQTVSTVLFETRFGHVWTWTLASAAILLFVLSMPRGGGQTTLWTALIAGLSAFLIASSAWTGHAVMHGGLTGAIHSMVQVVHVLAASAWLGSLPALGFALHKARRDGQAAWRDSARRILPRYSRMGYLAVGLIVLTGCLSSWFMVDSVDALFSTAYGRILIAKIGLFVLMVSVAAVNRLVLTPRILDSKGTTVVAERAVHQLWRNVAIEQFLGLSIIAVVSVLGTVAPAMSGHMEM